MCLLLSSCYLTNQLGSTAHPAHCASCAGGGKPRDYQDERFSYVVLQRGERPDVPADTFLMASGAEAAPASHPLEEAADVIEELETDVIEEVGFA
jgi:hypothetical protein